MQETQCGRIEKHPIDIKKNNVANRGADTYQIVSKAGRTGVKP
jgi:hypothetical protein